MAALLSSPHLDHISDQNLVETLKHGIGFYHEAFSNKIIASKVRCWFLD